MLHNSIKRTQSGTERPLNYARFVRNRIAGIKKNNLESFSFTFQHQEELLFLTKLFLPEANFDNLFIDILVKGTADLRENLR